MIDLGHSKVLHHHTKSLNMDTGEVVETETKVLLKKQKRERFMKLYVENFGMVVELSKKTQAVLAKIISNLVTYGTNQVVLSSGIRTQLAEELETSKQVIANAISELVTKEVLGRKKLSGGGFVFHLNPHIFGNGEWNTIEKQRQQYTIDYDFQNYTATKEVTAITSYEGLPDKENIQVLKREKYVAKDGVTHFTALIEDKNSKQSNQQEISVEPIVNDIQTPQTDIGTDTIPQQEVIQLEILREQNRAKELSIKEKELSIKELELKVKLDSASAPKLFD